MDNTLPRFNRLTVTLIGRLLDARIAMQGADSFVSGPRILTPMETASPDLPGGLERLGRKMKRK